MDSPFRTLRHGQILPLTEPPTMDPSAHRWDQSEIDALTLAFAAQRPLLVRGEPGTGKTQLARAAAQHLGWALLAETIHPRYEAQDLVWRFDAVRRLADAQGPGLKAEEEYWEPGALWRAYGWDSACRYGSCRDETRPAGHAILIDEIDKADSDLPNSLLEVLGQRSFPIPPLRITVGSPVAARPLIVVTTNEERELPAAFMRRCIVLNLAAPAHMSYRDWLVQRGHAHFGVRADRPAELIAADVIGAAADQLVEDRESAVRAGLAPPGPAEFLDLLLALHRLAPDDAPAQRGWIERLSAYAFIKHGLVEGHPRLAQTRPPLSASKE